MYLSGLQIFVYSQYQCNNLQADTLWLSDSSYEEVEHLFSQACGHVGMWAQKVSL